MNKMRMVCLFLIICFVFIPLNGCFRYHDPSQQDWNKIQEDATRRIELDPNDEAAYRERLTAYLSQQKLPEALDDFVVAMRFKDWNLDGNDRALWYTIYSQLSNKNLLYILDGLPEDARTVLLARENALLITPTPNVSQPNYGQQEYQDIPSTPNTLPPSILLFDIMYISTGQRISAEIKESDFLGTIASSVSITEWPCQNGQTNLEYLVGSPYALYGDGIAVRWGNEGWWMQFRNQAAIYAEESGGVYIGMVKIISGDKEYAPLQNWIYSLKDGVAGDGFRKQPESVADALPAIPLGEDFHIVIDGKDFLGQSYALYERTNGAFNLMYSNVAKFTAPTKPGEYILSMEVSWGNENRYEGFQYLIRLIK